MFARPMGRFSNFKVYRKTRDLSENRKANRKIAYALTLMI